ncbi:hypothetical protein CKAN_01653500 [Cinnamomum micranthum f. kanehirae]|uniref:Uncharacterized protein n=1 Tax=Cinnamomum micranthum f. kanehirae TaxID=337451 RepID=A0A3S3QPF0_9MAGN|nr:hypothetical protein CKAN_01653500 [Cinnamomum micranthum f. kanehirae]
MESGRFDGYDRDCLDVCLELYKDLKSTLRDTLKVLEEKGYRDANVWSTRNGDGDNGRRCERGREQIERGRMEKTERAKEGGDGRHPMDRRRG